MEMKLAEEFLNHQLAKIPIKGLADKHLFIGEDDFSFNANAKKWFVTIHVEITLQPMNTRDRMRICRAVCKKPLFLRHILELISRPSLLQYQNNEFSFDLDAIKSLHKIPFGKIKDCHIKKHRLHVFVGL